MTMVEASAATKSQRQTETGLVPGMRGGVDE
jgi:hypothetical protein